MLVSGLDAEQSEEPVLTPWVRGTCLIAAPCVLGITELRLTCRHASSASERGRIPGKQTSHTRGETWEGGKNT